MVYCKKCGKENKRGKFCRSCGEKLPSASIPPKFKFPLIIGGIVIAILFLLEISALNVSIEDESFLGDVKRMNYMLAGIEVCGNGVCAEDELYVCKKDCVWCGDNLCQKEEIGNCYEDCEWCGDGYCQSNENCNSCSKDCGSCKASSYCGDGICNPEECQTGCSDCSTTECENGICEKSKGENCVNAPNDCKCSLDEMCNKNTKKCETITCGNGKCESGENPSNCPADCKEQYIEATIDPYTNIPIIFVHGHSSTSKSVTTYSINAWNTFQSKLASDGYYYDEGAILPNSYIEEIPAGMWGKKDKPISVRTTYYGGILDSSGKFTTNEDDKSIDEYAERLGNVVDVVLHHTGKKKVNIVAHSMGGLVARAYIKNQGGSGKVDKLIMVGTPNHGIFGYVVAGLCDVFHSGKECDEMQDDSSFLTNLNYGDETPGNINYLTIAGDCCINSQGAHHDEVVRVTSVNLDGAKNIVINGNEYSGSETFHTKMLNPYEHPQVYSSVTDFLLNK